MIHKTIIQVHIIRCKPSFNPIMKSSKVMYNGRDIHIHTHPNSSGKSTFHKQMINSFYTILAETRMQLDILFVSRNFISSGHYIFQTFPNKQLNSVRGSNMPKVFPHIARNKVPMNMIIDIVAANSIISIFD